jgi:hypothetical protein
MVHSRPVLRISIAQSKARSSDIRGFTFVNFGNWPSNPPQQDNHSVFDKLEWLMSIHQDKETKARY